MAPRAARRAPEATSGLAHERVLALVLVVATLVAYLPLRTAGFVWDDDWYVTGNRLLRDVEGLKQLWVPGNTPQYYPAVFTSFWIEHQLWGLDPLGYHAVNVLLHVLDALLVWKLCRDLSIPGAYFVAAVFALHPVHVESVAWISERKNVQSAFFYLTAALAYRRFDADGPPEQADSASDAHRWRWYVAAFVLFVLALLSKTVTCSLPAALILMMLWERRRIGLRRLIPLAPLFLAGLALALHTVHVERTQVGAEGADFAIGAHERTLIACRALLFYPQKLLLPWPLVFVYPRWTIDAASPLAHAAVLAVAIVAALAIAGYRRGARGPALALAYYAGTIFPALGFVNVYPMRYTFVADHYQYLASVAIIALVTGGIATLAPRRTVAIAAGGLVLAIFMTLTWRQCSTYADQETLWRTTLRSDPRSWMAHSNLAKLLSERGENDEALELLRRGLPLAPKGRARDQVQLNLALTLGKLGRDDLALEQYRELQRSAGGMDLRVARTLERLGRDDEAEAAYRAALAGADASDALIPFGVHLVRRGRPEEALVWLERFVETHPDDTDGLMFLADTYATAGRLGDAIRSAEHALETARARGEAPLAESIEKRLGLYRGSGASVSLPE